MKPAFLHLAFLAAVLAACFCDSTVGAGGCSEIQRTGKYSSRIVGERLRNQWRRCSWTVAPKDSNHIVRLWVTRVYCPRQVPERPKCFSTWCSSIPFSDGLRNCIIYLTVNTSSAILRSDIRKIASQLHSNRPQDISSISHPLRKSLIANSQFSGFYNTREAFFSAGPLTVKLIKDLRNKIDFELIFEQIPIVHPGSSDLCPKPTMLSTKHQVPETHTGRRLVSVKQVMLKSDDDCRTSVLSVLPTGQTSSSRGNKLMVSVNCTRTSGSLTVVADDAVSSVACNSVGIQLSWTQQLEPVTVVSEETGGFTAKLDQLLWIPDGSFHCPKYNPASHKPWIANLPLLIGSSSHEDIFYCLFTLSPPPGHDLMVQVHLSFTDNLMEQFCKLLSTGPYLQPHLSFIKSAPNSSDYEVRLCDHQMPGSLLVQNRIRVMSGESLTVDLIATQLHPQLRNHADIIGSPLRSKELDAVIVVHQVVSCPSPGHISSWQLSPDRTRILRTLTVVPGNSQTNCNLQVTAASAVSIANEMQIHKPNAANLVCWDLGVMLHKFDTTCGLHQLMLTVSYWDSVAESTVHKQKEVCGSDSFTWNVAMLTQADNATGMSLWFSGVRSGFVAQFSLTACENSVRSMMHRTGELIGNGDNGPLILMVPTVLLLALGNLCVVLFVIRQSIRSGAPVTTE